MKKPATIIFSGKLCLGFLTLAFILNSARSLAQCLPHTISVTTMEQVLYACPGDGKPDEYIFLKSDTSQNKYAFVLADGADNIIRVQTSPNFNFDGALPASFRVWGISYSDSIAYSVGNDVSTISPVSGCLRLSENLIPVFRDIPRSLDVQFINNRVDTLICATNSSLDTLRLKTTGSSVSKQIFVLSLFNGLILDTFSTPWFTVEHLPLSSYAIYSMSYTGSVNIQKNVSRLTDKTLATGCFNVGGSPASFVVDTLYTGTVVSLTDQSIFCPMDGNPDLYTVGVEDGKSPFVAVVLVDQKQIVRQVANGLTIDLDNNAEGIYTVMVLQYSGKLLLKPGDTVSRSGVRPFSTDCYTWALDEIDIRLVEPFAGSILAEGMKTLLFACPGDNLPDRFSFNGFGQSPNNYAVVAVGAGNKVLAMTTGGGFIDFERFPLGQSRIYGISYTGTLRIGVDSVFTGDLSTDCYSVTPNYITVLQDVAKGGMVGLANGSTSYFICPGETNPNLINLVNSGASNSPYQYVLTTETGTVLDFIVNDTLVIASGTLTSMRIYGVAYTGNIVITKASNLFVSAFSDGCFNVSSNFVRVIRDLPRGGGVRLPDGSNKELFCPSDTQSRILEVRNVNVSQNPYNLVLTDSNLVVKSINTGFIFNFDGYAEGQYFIYGVSFIGERTLNPGDLLDFSTYSTGCFTFSSNFIQVTIGMIDGGVLTSSEGSDIAFVCPANLDLDLIRIIPQNSKSLSYRFVITDDKNIIQDFSSSDQINFGSGVINTTSRVYGVAYKGEFLAQVNQNALQTVYSNQCFDLSNNYVTIRKTVPPPHRIQSNTKDTVLAFCKSDGREDTARLSTSDSVGFKTAYILLDSTSKILRISSVHSMIFNQEDTGTYRLYSSIYTGRLLITPGLTLISGLSISDDCFSLSSNFLTIRIVNDGPACVITSAKQEDWYTGFNVYPNPTQDEIRVEFSLQNGKGTEGRLDIVDLTGRTVYTMPLRLESNNQFKVPLTNLDSGIYLVRIRTLKHTASRKLIIGK